MFLSLRFATALVVAGLLATGISAPAGADCTLTSIGQAPLTDLGAAKYLAVWEGGLYPGGDNARPVDLQAEALARANEIVPLGLDGEPDPVNGKIVLISIGLSNTNQEYAVFVDRALADPALNPATVPHNAARGGWPAPTWADPDGIIWDQTDVVLDREGLSPNQVQVAWVKNALSRPVEEGPFPDSADVLSGYLGDTARALLIRFPNIKLAYYSSRTRAWTDDPDTLNPEPFAYESGFSVKWLIERQLALDEELNWDPARGPVKAPLLLWGPYLWADGLVPRSDGYIWPCDHTRQDDFTHPSEIGMASVADQLLAFFKTDPTATPWFLKSTAVGQPPVVTATALPAAGVAPLTVTFDFSGNDPDGTIEEVMWTFGDGTFSLASSPTKTYVEPGTYQAHVAVSDDDGNTTNSSVEVQVLAEGDDDDDDVGCEPGPRVLCLRDERFEVTVTWKDFEGLEGDGSLVDGAQSDDSGLFWFFKDTNWEMLVKVLNGCGFNDRYWVFAAATTNVEYSLRVVDTLTGAVKTYDNQLGVSAPAITDTSAFATCP